MKKKSLSKSAALLIAIFLVLPGCTLHTDNSSNKNATEKFNYDYQVVGNNLFIYIDDLNSRMILADLDPGENHTVEEYKTLDLTDQDVFARYLYTGKEEAEKVIKSLGYDDWNDYLIKQNHIDKNNEPDFHLWLFRWEQKVYDNAQAEKERYEKR